MSLLARYRIARARRIPVDRMAPAIAALYWLNDERRARTDLADALSWPSEFGHLAAQAEDDIAYAVKARNAAWAKARERRRFAVALSALSVPQEGKAA